MEFKIIIKKIIINKQKQYSFKKKKKRKKKKRSLGIQFARRQHLSLF